MADVENRAVYKLTASGSASSIGGGFEEPVGVAVDSSGDVFVTDFQAGNIYKLTPSGSQTTFASGLNGPEFLTFDSSGNLFETDFNSGNIYEFMPGGTRSTFASGLSNSVGLTFNSSGKLFAVSGGSIDSFTSGGSASLFASGLNAPMGLAFSASGDLFEADYFSGNIYEFTPAGIRSTFASGQGNPRGLAFDNNGSLFEAEQIPPSIIISQTGSLGNYSYSVTGSAPGANNMPVFDVSWGDAARFCNWLQNGQPTGPEGNGTTETGAYALGGGTSGTALMAVSLPSHSGSGAATYFIPSENEWYKAAYYQSGGTNSGYWGYPTQSNVAPDNSLVLAASESNDANSNNSSFRANFILAHHQGQQLAGCPEYSVPRIGIRSRGTSDSILTN